MGNKYLIRQCFVAFGFVFYAFCEGMIATFPSVLNPALLSSNTTDIKATPDEASWLASCNSITGLIGYFTLSPIMQKFGRRKTHFGINITIVVGWLTILFANSVTMLFIARLIQGLTLDNVHKKTANIKLIKGEAKAQAGWCICIIIITTKCIQLD
ncbi:facilitated trehalose transporter Tret1-like isoform X3 [Galleria mellonella]|uniref:Facilitated trehalose transporter Tret1-like isoform X3 n=1 Tax=Galleria mellonella TaxID=7137 RepID=A0ABM3MP13_GALME|nr:facilitated trehalose transporter Tret1-like isoform X3 [Galleria mellonella]